MASERAGRSIDSAKVKRASPPGTTQPRPPEHNAPPCSPLPSRWLSLLACSSLRAVCFSQSAFLQVDSRSLLLDRPAGISPVDPTWRSIDLSARVACALFSLSRPADRLATKTWALCRQRSIDRSIGRLSTDHRTPKSAGRLRVEPIDRSVGRSTKELLFTASEPSLP